MEPSVGLTLFSTGFSLGTGLGVTTMFLLLISLIGTIIAAFHAYYRYINSNNRIIITIMAGLFWPFYMIYQIYNKISN